ncbi:hypothetical protein CBR_g26339 [Chara braunii]|uniref:Uncharacterized protein n=1 Tax=Chara braunii TaxID=69332 RepID=A0A388L7M7_CHABU|nr:hypothetical protein CBR_g26339 [Chara braunii]|eukprot:GBG78309.1 hypothetical protein CBR_g26339 [Chara braunii]
MLRQLWQRGRGDRTGARCASWAIRRLTTAAEGTMRSVSAHEEAFSSRAGSAGGELRRKMCTAAAIPQNARQLWTAGCACGGSSSRAAVSGGSDMGRNRQQQPRALLHSESAAAAAAVEEAKELVGIKVDGVEYRVPKGMTLLQACRDLGIYIPAVCYHPALKPVGTCRLCLVDTGGWRMEPACTKEVAEGLTVRTHTDEVFDTVKGNLALMRLKHPNACSTCSVNSRCEFQDLLLRYGVEDPPMLEKQKRVDHHVEEAGIAHEKDESSPALSMDFDKCILCLRCVRACNELQGMNILGATARGDHETVAPLYGLPLGETSCLSCGQCAAVCPVGSITEKSHVRQVEELLQMREAESLPPRTEKDWDQEMPKTRLLWGPRQMVSASQEVRASSSSSSSSGGGGGRGYATTSSSRSSSSSAGSEAAAAAEATAAAAVAPRTGKRPVMVAQTAPAVRVTIAEAFGMEPGSISTGHMVAALRKLGFDYVFDTNFSADLTIMEEATELLGRVKSGGPFPMFTSCCPGWINMVEKTYPELIPNLSSCKSPQQMLGAVVKSHFAASVGRHPSEVKFVSVMPCVAKKDEAARKEMHNEDLGGPDVDYVLTTRELASLIERARPRINFASLKEAEFDSPLGQSSGAALLFGVTGGVMEAALRTAVAVTAPADAPPMPKLDFTEVRGLDGVKEANIDVNGTELKVAIAHGGVHLRSLVEDILAGKRTYHFVEMMACRGGCIGGAGNPKDSVDEKLLQHRAQAIYKGDEASAIRMSHENKEIAQLYEQFFGEPNSHKAHKLLHTHYTPRKVHKSGEIDRFSEYSPEGPSELCKF